MDTDRNIKDRDCDSDNCQDVSAPSTIVAATDGTYSTDIFVYCIFLSCNFLNYKIVFSSDHFPLLVLNIAILLLITLLFLMTQLPMTRRTRNRTVYPYLH